MVKDPDKRGPDKQCLTVSDLDYMCKKHRKREPETKPGAGAGTCGAPQTDYTNNAIIECALMVQNLSL